MGPLTNAFVRTVPVLRGVRPSKVAASRRVAEWSRSASLAPGCLISHRRRRTIPRQPKRSVLRFSYIDEDLYGDDDDDLDDDEVMGFGADLGGDEDEAADPSEAMEALLDDEEEETDADDEEEAEISADTEQDPPSGCPKGFALSFLWLDKYIAFAVDQIFGNKKRIPLTEYFIWPRTDAWEELRQRLSENAWIDETDQILLLNRATQVINFWQDEEQGRSLDDARLQFPDCVFMGS